MSHQTIKLSYSYLMAEMLPNQFLQIQVKNTGKLTRCMQYVTAQPNCRVQIKSQVSYSGNECSVICSVPSGLLRTMHS